MNQRLWRIVSKTLFLSILGVGFVVGEVFAALPRAHHVYISGSTAGANPTFAGTAAMKRGSVLRVRYTYADADGNPESGTTFQWYRYDDNFGTNKTAIAGATSTTYTLAAADEGKHISVEVRPRNAVDGFGATVEFRPWDAARPNPVYIFNANCFTPSGVGVPTPGNLILNPGNICSPRSLDWQIDYTGINYRAGLDPKIIIDWADGTVETLDPFLSNDLLTQNDTFNLVNMSNQKWRVIRNHIYNYGGGSTPSTTPGEICTYTMRTTWGFGTTSCTAVGVQQQKFTVWDNESNTNLGQVDINHDPTSAGTPTGEIVDVCEGDNSAIRLLDSSDFNCTPAGARVETPNPNNAARWVQFVYGTASTITAPGGAGGSIIIGGVSYSSAQLPVYGTVQYLASPTLGPLPSITANIQMPGTAVTGETFVVTMRTWNTCSPFDLNVLDGNGLNPPQVAPFNVFNIYGPPGNIQAPSLGGPPFFANATPATRIHTIRIIDSPPAPTVSSTIFCEAQATGTYNLTFSGANGTYNVYDNPALITPIFTDATSPYTYNPVTQGTAPSRIDVTPPPSNPSSYTRYVTVTTANGCTSPPLTFVIEINAPKTGGAIAHPLGASPQAICSGDNPVAFTSSSSGGGGNGIAGDDQYQWQSSPDGSAWSDIGGATGLTFDPGVLVATTHFRRRVREPYFNITGNCDEAFSNVYIITVDTPVTGGTIGNPQTICTGSNPAIITNLVSPTGGNGSYGFLWQEANAIAGPYGPAAGTNDQITYDPPVLASTKFYRRLVTSGACAPGTALSNVIEITVDQIVVPGAVNNPQTICAGQDPAILGETTLPSGGNGSTYTFQWQESAVGGGVGFAAAPGTNNNATYDPPVLTATRFYRRRVTSGVCPPTFSNEIQITVNPLPTAPNPTGGGAVCSGNPAPDIVWTGLTGAAPYNITVTLTPGGPMVINGHNSTTFTIVSPSPGVNTTYQITSLEDSNGCFAAPGTMGNTASVTIGGAAPALDSPFALDVTTVCDDGISTTDPILSFSLVDADFANQGPFILNYRIDGLNKPAKNFNTNASGTPTLPISFTDAELNSVGAHIVRIVSIISPATCQTIFNADLPFTVNPRPPTPANPINAIACSTDATGATLQVDIPAVGNLIQWFSNAGLTIPAVGVTGGTRQNTFTPTSNATATYFAVTQSQTAPTFCTSTGSTMVQHTQDVPPTVANAGNPTEQTCNTSFVLAANLPNGGLNEVGYWTVGGQVYHEGFGTADNGVGASWPGPTVTSPSNSNWSVDVSGAGGTAGGYLRVQGGVMEANDVDGEVVWQSSLIDISTSGLVDVSLDIAEAGTMEAGDYIRAYYSVNGGGPTLFTNGDITDDNGVEGDGNFRSVVATGLSGATLQIIVRFNNNASGAEFHRLDNVRVYSSGPGFPTISDPNSPTATVSNLQVGANTLTWHIRSQFDVCPETTDNIVITRIALPVGIDVNTDVCEDVYLGGERDNVDLTTFDAAVTGGVPNRSVQWFTNAARTVAVPTPTDVDGINNSDTFYALITETLSGSNCQNVVPGPGSVTFTVNPLPEAVAQDATNPETVYCEEFPVASGIADDVNLTILEDDIINGAANRSVAWFESDMSTAVATPNDIDGVVDGRIFFARVTNTITNCINFAQVEITVNPLPVDNPIQPPGGGAPASITVCAGTSILLFQVNPTLNPGSTYAWVIPTAPGQFELFGGGGVNDFFALIRFPNVVGPLAISVTETSADGCVGNTNSMNITVDSSPPAPVITGDQNVCANEQNVNYSVPLNIGSTYTWTVPGTLGSIVSGQGTSSIIVNMSTTSGNITVVETNLNGCISPPAAPLPVTVNARPVMTSLTSAEICSGGIVSGAHTLTGSIVGTVFDWVVVGKVGPVGGASVGNTGSGQIGQTLTNTSASVGQVIYDVTPKIDIDPGPGTEFCNGPTQTLTINVYPEPVGQNAIRNVCSDIPLVYDIQVDNINALGNGLPSLFTYTVLSSDPGNVPAEADRVAPSNAPINHTYTNTTTAVVTVTYTISPRFDAVQACPGSNFTLTVNVRPEPVGGNDVATICSGSNVNYDLIANITAGNGLTAGTTFSWVAADNPNVSGESLTPQTATTINNTLTNFTTGNEDVVYTVTPISSLGCSGNNFTVTVTVQPAPVGSNSTATVCSDTALGINLTTSGAAVAAATYNITNIANGGLSASAGGPVTGTGFPAAVLADDAWTNIGLNPVNVVYTIVPVSAAGCAGASFTVTVTVDPEPVGNNGAVTRCSDNAVNFSLTTNLTSVAASTYNISVNANGLTQSAGTDSNGNGKAANELVDDVWRNTGLASVDVIYTIIPVSGVGCPGNPFTVTATINPEPVGIVSTGSFCSDQVLGVNITTQPAAVPASNFNITVNPNGLIQSAGTSSAGNGKLATEIADDSWRNLGLAPVNVIYTITPISGVGCLGDDFTITATINPEPVGSNSAATICSDVPTGITLTTSGTAVAAATYNIVTNANGLSQSAGTVSAGAGKLASELADDAWTNTGLTPVNVVYTVTPVSAAPESCQGDPFTVTVTVNPEPVGANSSATRCSDVAVGVTLTTTAGAVAASSYNIAVANGGLTLSGGTASAGTGKAANEIADDIWRNTGLLPVDVVYTVTPVSAAGCAGDPFTVTITVNPEPVGANSSLTICSDNAVGVNLTTSGASVAADNYTIAVTPNGLSLSAGTPSAGTGKANSEIADDVWRNTGLSPVDVVYTITPVSLAGCSGDPFTVTVTVNPEPVGSNSNLTVCSDVAVGVNITTSAFAVAAASFDISVVDNGLSLVGGTNSNGVGKAANEIADDVWRNTGAAAVNVVYTITPVSAAPCNGDPFTITVAVNPEPVLAAGLDATVCSDNIVNLVLNTNGASVTAANYNIVNRTVAGSLTPVVQAAVPANGVAANYLRNEIYRNTTNGSLTVQYDVVPVGSIGGCLGDQQTITITIDPEPVVSGTLDATVCSDSPVNLVLATTGTSVPAANYNIVSRTVAAGLTPVVQVGVSATGVAANYLQTEVYRNTTAASLTVQYVVEATGTINGCLGDQRTITITVAPEPVISPTLDASVCSDNIVNLVLNTNGTSVAALNYNIVSRTVAGSLTPVTQVGVPANNVAANYLQNEVYRNTTAGSLTIQYVVEATGSISGCLGDQRTITITVDPEPIVSGTLNASVCSDNAVNLLLNTAPGSVAASSYNIVSRTVAGGLTPVTQALAPVNGVPANHLQNEVYRNTTNGSLTVQYVVEARGIINNCLGDQRTITITIDPEPVIATNLNASVCSDAIVGLVFNTNGTSVGALSYNIVSRTVNPSLIPVTESPVANGVAANYVQNDVYRNTTNASLPVQYVVEALGTINGCLGDQRTITITIDPEPVISPTLDATVCSDSPVGLVLNTNGTSVSASNYNIVNRIVDPALTPVTQVAVSANGVAANYLQNEVYRNTTNASHTVQYIVEARGNINGCLGNQETITITIDPEPVISAGLNATVCSDIPVGLVLNTNGTSIGAANYNIVSRIVAGTLTPVTQVAVPATGVADNYLQNEVYSNTTNGPLTVQYVVEARGTINNCLGDQRTITITINPEPVISPTLNATVCSNDVVNLILNTNGTSVGAASYEIMSRTVAGVLNPITQVAVPQAGVAANYLQNEVYENTTNASLTVQYQVRAVGTTGACTGDPRIITITIDPEPIVSPALDASVCSDNTVNLVLNTNGTSISAVNYNVVSRTVDPALIPVNQVGMPGNNVLPTYLQNEVYRNTTAASLPVQYVVEATGAINGCVGPQRTITIMVDPEPVVANTLDASICSDDIVNLVLNTNGTSIAAASYNVLNRIVAGGLTPVTQVPVPQNGVADNYLQNEVYTNTTNTSLTVQYVVQGVGTINGCLGDQRTITITIAPEPVVATNLDKSVCSDLAVGLTLNTNGTSIGALNYNIVSRTVDPSLNPINQVAIQNGVAANYLAGEIYQNNGATPLDVVYVVEAVGTIAGCVSDQRTITVTIQPEPVMDPGLDIAGVCSGLTTGLTLDTNGTSVAAANYNVQMITVAAGLTPNGGNTPVPATGVAANYLTNHSFRNTGPAPLDVVYRVVPVSAAGCLGDFIDITVTIDPEPVVDPSLSATVCSDQIAGITLNTNGVSVGAANYNIALISQDAGLIGTPTTGNGLAANAIFNDVFNNTTFGPLTVVYQVTPFSAIGCQGQPVQITLTVRPEPVLNPALDITRCSDFDFNVSLATNGTSVPAGSYNITNIVVAVGLNARAGNIDPTGVPYNNVGANFLAGDSFENPTNGNLAVQYTVVPVSPQGCLGDPVVVTFTVQPEPVLDPALNPVPVCSDVISSITLGVDPGPPASVAAASYNINNIIRQPGLVAGGSNASIGAGQAANAIFNDTFTNTSAGPLTVTYKVVPVSAAGCLGDEADVVLTINPSPAIAAGLDRSVCTNEASGIIFATSGSSAPAAMYDITNVVIAGAAGDLIQTNGNSGVRSGVAANEIQNDQFQNTTNNPLTVTYTVRGETAAGCKGPTRDIVLTIEPTILAVPVNNLTNICSATQTDIDLTSPTVPTSGNITFNYTAVSSIGGQITGFVPALNNLPLNYKITDNLVNNSNSAATVTYTITPVANGAKGGAGCLGTPVPVVVNVEPKPKLVASPLLQTVCESDGVNVSPTNILLTTTTVPSVGTVEFQVISAVPTGGMTLQPASMPMKTVYLNGQTIADQWNNPTLTDQTVTYTLQPVVNGGLGCPGDNVVVTITVKPRPIITPVAPLAVCSGEFRSIPLTTDIPGTFATWTVSAPGTITGALNGGGSSLDITLFNSGFNVETVTYTVTPKFNNCDGIPTNIVVTVNPTPNTVGLPASITVCDGQTLNIPLSSSVPGTTFDWTVTDVFNLEAPGFFDGNGTTINQVVNNTSGFQAILIYQVTPTTPAGCVGLPRIMNVTVGSIVANVTPDRTEICSGQRIQMTNSSLGATSHRWFYRVQGTTTEIDVRTTPFVNYQLDNTTTTNPLVYEIVYQPKNGLCTVPDVVTPITVYRNVIAGFNEGTVPPIIGGTSTVNFTNTSNPVDGAQFRYEWDFGSTSFANPPTFIGATPPPVVYSQQGPYQVTVKAINIAGEGAGLSCESMFTKTIVVPVLPLVADFTLDPPAGCFPTTVRVIENNSTGDIMEWKVVDSNGGIVAVSGQDLPEFFISTPGLFNVQLTTRDSFTDQVEFANQNFEIYEVPVASFQARPATVFVPDTELTTFNFSTKANFYQWDFGDGETSDEREPKHVYKIEGVYDIVLVAGFDHDNGVVCTDTLSQKVIAKQGGITRVPNAFTPNPAGPSGGLGGGGTGSGGAGTFNDVFLPIVKGVEEFNMQIFDRWGNLIFESNNANQGWDGYDRNGRILPAGVYVYKLTLRLSDGQRTTQIGDITMIR